VGVVPGAIVEIGVVGIEIAEPEAAEIAEVGWRRRPWA